MEPARPLQLGMHVGDAETLARCALLSSLTPRDLGMVTDRLDLVVVAAGSRVSIDAAFVVLEGEAERIDLTGARTPLRAGSQLGLECLAGGASTTQLHALTDTRCARLSSAGYAALVERHATLALHLSQALSRVLADELSGARGALSGAPRAPAQAAIAVQVGERVIRAEPGTLLRAFLDPSARAVGGLLENRPMGIDTPILYDASVAPLLESMSEGRQLLLRSLGLVVLEAAAMVAPALRVWWGPSLGVAHIAMVERATAAELHELAPRLERAIADLVAGDVPFREEQWSVERAAHHFRALGWDDAAALLRTRRDPTVTLVRCGTQLALRMGPVLASAADLGVVRVRPHATGFVIELAKDLPGAASHRRVVTQLDAVAQENARPRFGSEMAVAQQKWLHSLDITSVGAFNTACIEGRINELVLVSEGFQEKRVSQLADLIAARRDAVRVIRMAGPSASGKTTFIKRLKVQLQINGLRPINLSLDDYYVDRDRTPRDELGELDFESVDALDGPRLQQHVTELLAGRTVRTSRFDFVQGRSLPQGGPEMSLGAGDVLVLEGLHALNPELLGSCLPCGASFGVFVHPATTLRFDRLNAIAAEDLRLLRRIVRDRFGRGHSAAENILRWPSVRRGELARVFPSEAFADAVFDSSLVYEISVLKVFAERYLLEVPQEHPAFPTALRLRSLVDQFVTIDPGHVPLTSLLHEFIGCGR